MPIPPLTDQGQLPPGDHLATMDEVRERFGSASIRRQQIMTGLEMTLQRLMQHGASRVWLNGSFVTDEPRPGDVDVVCDPAGTEPEKWTDIVGSHQHGALKRQHRVDLYVSLPVKRQFETDRDGNPKGLVEVHLS